MLPFHHYITTGIHVNTFSRYSQNVDFTTLPVQVLVFKAYRSSGAVPVNNGYVPYNNIDVIYRASGCNATLSSGRVYLTLPYLGDYFADVHISSWVGSNTWDYMLFEGRRNSTGFTRGMAYKCGSWGFFNMRGITTVSAYDLLGTYLNTSGNIYSDGNTGPLDTYMYGVVYRKA